MTRLESAITELADALLEQLRAELAEGHSGPERLLTVDEAAQALALGRSKIYELVATARLQSITIGRARRVPASAVAAFINGGNQKASDVVAKSSLAVPRARVRGVVSIAGASRDCRSTG